MEAASRTRPGAVARRRDKQSCVAAHHDQFEPKDMREQIVEMQDAFALLGAQIAEREQAGEPAPAGAVARIGENVGRAVGEDQPRARVIFQREILLALGEMRAHDAGDRIAVAEAEAGKADRLRLHHQLFRMRGAAQEGEIGGTANSR